MSYSWRLTQILYPSRQEKRKRWAVLAPHSAALGCSQSGGFYHSYSTWLTGWIPRNLLAAHSGRYVALRQSGVGPGRPISEGRAFPSFFSVCSSVLLVFSSIFWFCPSVFLNLFFFKHEFFYFSSLIFKIWSFFEFEQFLSLNMFLFWTILNLNFFWVWTIFQVWYFLKFVKKLPNIFQFGTFTCLNIF
jgi:hypothetical protein